MNYKNTGATIVTFGSGNGFSPVNTHDVWQQWAVCSFVPANPFGASDESLERFADLEANWDGYGALPISEETRRNGEHALRVLSCEVPSPDITPNANGTLSFEWESSNCVAHLEVGMTRFSFYIQPTFGETVFADGMAFEFDRALASRLSSHLSPARQRTETLTHLELGYVPVAA